MKKVLSSVFLFTLSITVISQININDLDNIDINNFELSNFWNVEPILYNSDYKDKNRVYEWQNYWYMRENDTLELIPDTLNIRFFFSINTIYIYDFESFINENSYIFKSFIQYKYGETDYSYNIKNPKLSDKIELIEQEILLSKITKDVIKELKMPMFDIFINIPIKTHLKNLDIYICDTNIPDKDFYALNQIIITSYFLDKNGELKNSFEFTFPINGSYKDVSKFGKIKY